MEVLSDLVAQRARLTPDKVAMHEVVTGRCVTYFDLNDRAQRLAGVFSERGVTEGERVAVLCRNRIAFFETLFACAKLGAIMAPLNWRMPPTELSSLIAMTRPKALCFGAEDAAAALSLQMPDSFLLNYDEDYDAQLDAASPVRGTGAWRTSDIWYLLFTSGTTGAPKAVIQTYGMALANYVNLAQAIDLRASDTTLNFLPLFHTAGINLHTVPTLFHGGHVMVAPGFDVEQVITLLAGGAISTFFGVPTVYQQIALHPSFRELDLRSVRHWGCGGAALPDALAREFAARGLRVCNGFGMTETGPTLFLAGAEAALNKIGSVGRAQILSQSKIVRADGSEAGAGETGELWVKGPAITPGYWNNPEATAEVMTSDGWLKTRDLARMDTDGDHYIVGRLKEMYISGGENVYPIEVENVLAQHPQVLEAAVVGAPDAHWGEVGWAFVLPRDGQYPSPDALIAFCREKLAAYKAPTRIILVEEFPRTAAGKVQKHKLFATPDLADEKVVNVLRTLTQADFDAFARLSGDDNPIHLNADFAAKSRFGRPVAHGAMLLSILRGLAAQVAPGARLVSQNAMFPAPTFADEPLQFSASIVSTDRARIEIEARCARVADSMDTCRVIYGLERPS